MTEDQGQRQLTKELTSFHLHIFECPNLKMNTQIKASQNVNAVDHHHCHLAFMCTNNQIEYYFWPISMNGWVFFCYIHKWAKRLILQMDGSGGLFRHHIRSLLLRSCNTNPSLSIRDTLRADK